MVILKSTCMKTIIMMVKDEWIRFQGKQLGHSDLPPFSLRGQLLKERICSHRSKFFLLRVDPILEALRYPGEKTGSHKNYSTL